MDSVLKGAPKGWSAKPMMVCGSIRSTSARGMPPLFQAVHRRRHGRSYRTRRSSGCRNRQRASARERTARQVRCKVSHGTGLEPTATALAPGARRHYLDAGIGMGRESARRPATCHCISPLCYSRKASRPANPRFFSIRPDRRCRHMGQQPLSVVRHRQVFRYGSQPICSPMFSRPFWVPSRRVIHDAGPVGNAGTCLCACGGHGRISARA